MATPTTIHAREWARAQVSRRLNLLTIKTESIRKWCVIFGISDKGSREEVIERYYKKIWEKNYDNEKGL